MLYNVFQPGLVRGAARLPHDPEKSYAYVEHPTEGWRVYLRAAAFLHREGHPAQFLVVKRRGARMTTAAWEPPKGQMEGKEWQRRQPIQRALLENVRREIAEEAHMTTPIPLQHTGLVFQSQETTYPANHFFQYHIYQGEVTEAQLAESTQTFAWMKAHPRAVERWSRDRKEKDAVKWFDPRTTRLNPRWCPDIVALYLRARTSRAL
jgi:8-oxo-dGTP pyrophosphatase MutT (NUDIX family)